MSAKVHRAKSAWPELPYTAWKDTYATLHLWIQIIGKIRLAQTPWLNHSWHVALYVSPRGLTTSSIPYGDRSFELEFSVRSACRASHAKLPLRISREDVIFCRHDRVAREPLRSP
jgi:hypothetical protein